MTRLGIHSGIAAPSRAILCAGFALAAACALPDAALSASPFTAAKISVDVTAKDAVTAKDQALDEAKQRALRVVLKRLTPYAAVDRLPIVKVDTIDGMLENFTIRSEQNSRTRYLATLDFEFNSAAVRRQLNGGNIGFSDVQPATVPVLPLYIRDGKVDATGRDPWRRAWLDLDLDHALTPVRLVQAGASLDAAGIAAMLAGEGEGFAGLLKKYEGNTLVLAVAEAAPNAPLSFKLYGVDAVGPFALAQTARVYNGDLTDAAGRAAKMSLGVLEGRWKVTETIPDSGGGDPARHSVSLTVEFSSLREWQDIRSRLAKVPGVQGMETASLSARSADVTFRYPGGAPSLATKLPSHSMSLMNVGGAWVLRGN